MQDSWQHCISTKESSKFAVAGINKRLVCKSYTDSNIVKTEEQLTLSENFSENEFYFKTTAKGWTKITIADYSLKIGFLSDLL